MTSVESGPLAPSNATKESHATFGSVPAAKRLVANADFKSASSSARKSFGAGLASTFGAGVGAILSGMLVNVFRGTLMLTDFRLLAHGAWTGTLWKFIRAELLSEMV